MIKFSELHEECYITVVDKNNREVRVKAKELYEEFDNQMFVIGLKYFNNKNEEIYIDKIPYEYLWEVDTIIVVNNKTKEEKITDVYDLENDLAEWKLHKNDCTFYLGRPIGNKINFYELMSAAIADELEYICSNRKNIGFCDDHKSIDFGKIGKNIVWYAADKIDYALRHGHETYGDFQIIFEEALYNKSVYGKVIEIKI